MRALSAKMVAGVLALAGASVVSPGCADNESTLFVVGVAKMESDCTYAPSESSTILMNGVLDIGFERSYEAGLVLANQMASRGQKSRSRTETSRIALEGAEVSLFLPSGEAYMDAFSAPGAGFVNVGAGEDPGYGLLSVVLIPTPRSEQKAILLDAGYVIAEVKAFGKTLGGQEVESNVFRFPIEICLGCLVEYPQGALVGGECTLSAEGDSEAAPCHVGQDQAVTCSVCAAAYRICQAPGAGLDTL